MLHHLISHILLQCHQSGTSIHHSSKQAATVQTVPLLFSLSLLLLLLLLLFAFSSVCGGVFDEEVLLHMGIRERESYDRGSLTMVHIPASPLNTIPNLHMYSNGSGSLGSELALCLHQFHTTEHNICGNNI